ncbi:hypothetical protein LPJ53_000682 [Coemansia erecta]|uniref:Ubiquitin carboxyl-terminal hydrolase n=1 Tax=Coemansia erecta TaxID=147472 RepID=A0A9W7Y721_9FUNG|nr:hypothetical protein LPJ53_000682 [Coemansia erecta]
MSFMKWMSGGASSSGNANGSSMGGGGGLTLSGGTNGSSSGEWPDNGDRYYGLVNVGNICYCSSVLQSLYFCRAFRECVNNYPYPRALPWSPPTNGTAGAKTNMGSVDSSSSSRVNLRSPERTASVLGAAAAGNAEHPVGNEGASTGEMSNLSRGRTLSTIREKASVLRWKRDRGGGDTADSATVSGSGDSKNIGGGSGTSLDTADGGSGDANAAAKQQQQQQQQRQPPVAAERSAIDIFTEDISSCAKYGIESSMFSELKDLFWLISTRLQHTGSLSPQGLVNKLKETNELFRSNAHQDAHEFLNYLLNEIAENVEKIYRDKGLSGSSGAPVDGSKVFSGNTWVHTLFEGLLSNETKCLSCERVTSRDERILDVSVDIHESSSVTSCLRQFAAGELLCHNNKFYCDSCGGLQEAERRMRLKRLPNILAVHLKRFKYHEGLGRYVKLSYRVNFPTELRVPNTAEETGDHLYSLAAVVVHLGGGPFHGHYISLVRSGDLWVLFDDDSVEVIGENELENYFGDQPNYGSGYVLFYERVDFDPALYEMPRGGAQTTATATATAANATVAAQEVAATGGVGERGKRDGLHASVTMPNLTTAGVEAGGDGDVAVAVAAAAAAATAGGRFAAPMRPPPLVSATRSVHGATDAPQMSPRLGSNGASALLAGTDTTTTTTTTTTTSSSSTTTTTTKTESGGRASLSKSRSWFSRRTRK